MAEYDARKRFLRSEPVMVGLEKQKISWNTVGHSFKH